MVRTTRLSLLSLALALLLAGLAAPVTAQESPGAITGVVFFDSNGNGLRDAGEQGGIPGAEIELQDATGQVIASTLSVGRDGSYLFADLTPGATYTVVLRDMPGYTITTPPNQTITVAGGQVTSVNFGATIPLIVKGIVWNDLDVDGAKSPGEHAFADAIVSVYRDSDGNGTYDLWVGSDVSDSQGFYAIGDLMPGSVEVLVTLSGGSSGGSQILPLISSEAGGIDTLLDFYVPPFGQSAWATLFGLIWNDLDGDEKYDEAEAPDAAEPVLRTLTCYLYRDGNQNGMLDAGEPMAHKFQSDSNGQYKVAGIEPGYYVLRVNEGELPGAYVLSTDERQLRFKLKAGEIKRLNIGYYDPIAVAPLRVGEWKKEIRQTGRPFYTTDQLNSIAAKAEGVSAVFTEVTFPLGILQVITEPTSGVQGQARKEHAALQMNVAAGRLLLATPIRLPELTTASTVEAAIKEIEALLAPPYRQEDATYERARKLAESLNKGKGIGYGLDATASIAYATYKSGNVTNKLTAIKDEVDLVLGQPIYLLRWNTGSIALDNVAVNPQLRVRVKRFENGGIIEVMQVVNGAEISLGTAVPPVWNKDINASYTFYLRNMLTVASLQNVELRLYLRDPADDGGPAEHARVDVAELLFRY